ncbi:hypothetical protein [Nocardia blacklockiae]|uniref:hypothetical protein n=1 Tax=Nocardia blacklockiae TaxID=480036 RepID=UPI001894362B|nr:hypothetical protein [Nocardia blacklockiae]MBF6173230.1 hypothetical protein [Nocardia blacklockiae]
MAKVQHAWEGLRYDVVEYPFAEIMREHLDVPALEKLHHYHNIPDLTPENEQSTTLHKQMYDIGATFQSIYLAFVKHVVEPHFGEKLVYQKKPNLRFQFPGSVAVANWHRDSDVGHAEYETNIWVPLTAVNDKNCVWMESRPGLGDYRPAVVPFGSALIFQAAALRHGNMPNTSDQTRVSFEFRVIKAADYQDRDERSVNMHKRFALGDYFDQF